jgi:hypothetical protein
MKRLTQARVVVEQGRMSWAELKPQHLTSPLALALPPKPFLDTSLQLNVHCVGAPDVGGWLT